MGGLLGFDPSLQVDHQDGDATNNADHNLRPATSSQNSMNRRLRSDNTSGVKGVCFDQRRGKWRTQVHVGNRAHHLGYYDDLAQAEAVVKAARERLHGEFARHE